MTIIIFPKKGEPIELENQDSLWSALNTYIKKFLGFNGLFRLDEITWEALPKNSGSLSVRALNGLCKLNSKKIEKIIIKLEQATNKIILINKRNELFEYESEETTEEVIVSEALEEYIRTKLEFDKTFLISEDDWEALSAADYSQSKKILLVNSFCKRYVDQIKKVFAGYETLYPIRDTDNVNNAIYENNDGYASVTGFSGDPTNITIKSIYDGVPVTQIASKAFNTCSTLISVIIPDSVTSIGDDAFWGCDSLESIEIPDSVTSIGRNAFYNCSTLVSVEIPDSVTEIGNHAFYNCESLESITIPDSVTTIGGYAFSDCDALASIEIGDSVTSIGDSAFYDTALYKNTENWQDGVLYINNHLIKAKTDISDNYTTKGGTLTVADYAFSSCDALSSITILDSVVTIGYAAFVRCTALESIKIGNGVTSIGDWAFDGCDELPNVIIGNNVTSIGNSAFRNCTKLASVTIPDSVTSIGEYAFGGCTKLASITIPDNVTTIGKGAFASCDSLAEISVVENNLNFTSSDGVLYNKVKTELLCCPGGKSGSFVIPDSVTTIGDSAFYNCDALSSITIPDSVTTIGDDTFSYCDALASIYYTGTEEQWKSIDIATGNNVLKNIQYNYSE